MSDNNIPDEDDRTIAELIASRSPLAAACWRFSEGYRIVGYSIALIGPSVIAVYWLFDVLRFQFSAQQFPDELKEWYFYVGLAFVLASAGWLSGRACERVQASLERHFC